MKDTKDNYYAKVERRAATWTRVSAAILALGGILAASSDLIDVFKLPSIHLWDWETLLSKFLAICGIYLFGYFAINGYLPLPFRSKNSKND